MKTLDREQREARPSGRRRSGTDRWPGAVFGDEEVGDVGVGCVSVRCRLCGRRDVV